MDSLITTSITRSTLNTASRPRLTMPQSAALDVHRVSRVHQQGQRRVVLINDLSTLNIAGVSDAACGAKRAYVSMGAFVTTRQGSSPLSPPV